MPTDAQLKMKDIEGLYDDLPSMPASIPPKRNRLDRKSLKTVLNIVIWIIKLGSSQVMASDWGAGGEGFNFFNGQGTGILTMLQ